VTEVPKIVQFRLRAMGSGRPEGSSHPDADVLAAFTEQALSQAERDGVLGHLALCRNCRDVVVLALPATEPAAAVAGSEAVAVDTETAFEPVSEKPRRSWFAWADMRPFNLRWAALTAGVAVALFAVYVGLGHRQNPASPGAARIARSDVSSAPAPQIASELKPQNRLETNAAKAEAQPETAKEKSEVSSGRMRTAFTKKDQVGQPGALVANSRVANSPAPAEQTLAPAAGELASSANETVETSAATTEVVTTSSDTDVMARGQALSVEKAKPPLEEAVAGKAGKTATAHTPMALPANGALASRAALPPATLKQGTMWMISAGLLKRSLDGGRSWQTVLEDEHSWLCYATHGQEVWAGGQAGALQHSNDGGVSWSSIAVTAHGQRLNSDVIQIDVQSPRVALTTANHEMWTSSDGGKVWEKK
jgi:Photosynthesis system II assembly factor YCF48